MNIPKRVYVFLVVGLVAASQSGNIIRIGDAHALAIAAWRLLFATMLLAPLAWRDLGYLKKLNKKESLLLLASGATLAAHFFAWIEAVKMTTVASASMFFSINPVLTATAGYFIFGERFSPKLFLSIGLGIAGVAVIGGSDFGFNPEHLKGDGAAFVCSILFTIYFLLGKKLRHKLPTGLYVTCIYGIAGLLCFAAMFFMDIPFVSYSTRNWVCFALMALVPTLLGHTSFNNALKYIDAGRISASTLTEPLLAGLVAYFAWDEEIRTGAFLGYGMIAASVLVLALDSMQVARQNGNSSRITF